MYIYRCIYVYLNIYTRVYIQIHVFVYICVHIYTIICKFIHTHLYKSVCIWKNYLLTYARSLSLSLFGTLSLYLPLTLFHLALSLSLWHSLSVSPSHSVSPSFSISLCPSLYTSPHARSSQHDINTGYTQLTCALCAPSMARETYAPRAAWVRVAVSTCVTFGPHVRSCNGRIWSHLLAESESERARIRSTSSAS